MPEPEKVRVTYIAFAVIDIANEKACYVGISSAGFDQVAYAIMHGQRQVRRAMSDRIKAAPHNYTVRLIETGILRKDKQQRRRELIKQMRTYRPYGCNVLG